MRVAWFFLAGAGLLALAAAAAAAASAAEPGMTTAVTAFSAQSRRQNRRPASRPRITVRPRERDLSDFRRVCEPVFEERWIPQWGGSVLYASQRCRWVRL